MTNREIIRFEEIESTSSKALSIGRQGAASGTVIIAETQTGGRGRLNRNWLSPPGTGLYFSVILRTALDPNDLPKITLAAGVAVCKAIELELGVLPKIKWPNDLLLDDKKFGGILSETGPVSESAAGQQTLVVIGIGLNIQEPVGGFPSDLQVTATTLSQHTDTTVVKEDLVLAIADALDKEVALLEKGEFKKILDQWKQRDGIKDRKLTWVTPKGEKVNGVSLGPDADGKLRIRDREGRIHEVISGDLNLFGKD
jgi:BirA family biotin operon repressor/biotin-[acetyl-CoA-carboxylase] ligase